MTVALIPLPPKNKTGRKPGEAYNRIRALFQGPVGGSAVFDILAADTQRRLQSRISGAAHTIGGAGWYATRNIGEHQVGIWKVSEGQGAGGANNAARVAQ